MFTLERRFELEYEGRRVEFTVKKITWAEYNRILASASKVTSIGGVPQVQIDPAAFRDALFKAAVVEVRVGGQTIPKSEYDALPYDLAEKIMEKVEELNPLAQTGQGETQR